MPIHTLKREGRRYAIGDFPVLPAFGMETFESQTLNFGGLEWGWAAGGVVTTYAGRTSYEDFETSTLNGGGNDFGWTGPGMLIFTPTAALAATFADLGTNITATVTTTGTGSFTYQWYQNGVALTNAGEYSGVTTATLTITGVTNVDYTTYFCAVTCLGDVVNSNTVTLADRATDWSNRVVTNGGAAPAAGTVTALRTFWAGMISDGISGSIKTLNVIAPDNLTAALTPFVVGLGKALWTNHGFVSGDLTVAGLIGDGSAKYLETGFVPSANYSSNAHAGVTLYVSAHSTNVAEQETGCIMSASQVLSLYGDYLSTTYFDAYDQSTGRINTVNTAYLGYLSGNVGTLGGGVTRAVFKANSLTPHATLVSGSAAATGTLPTQQMLAWAAYGVYPTVAQFSSKRLSIVGYHDELTAANSSNFFNRLQTLRTSFGGGYV